MKLQPDRLDGVNAITRHEPGRIWVNTTAWDTSVVVPNRGDAQAWAVARVDELTAEHFSRLLDLRPELVIFGCGAHLKFVRPALLRALIDAGIGVETMDTPAACRTFNVLASEGRIVAAALLIDPAA